MVTDSCCSFPCAQWHVEISERAAEACCFLPMLLSTDHPPTPAAKTLHPPEPEPSQRECREAQRAYT